MILIVGLGYLGKPLSEQLAMQGYSVLGTYRHHPPTFSPPLPAIITSSRYTLGEQHFPNAWHAAKTWVCLLPPSCSPAYVHHIQAWITYAEHCQIDHLIYSSSISVYGDQHGICTTDTPVRPATESAKKIVAIEEAIRVSCLPRQSILRLGGLYDKERHPIYRLLEKKHIANGLDPVNMLHRQKAVNALLHAICHHDHNGCLIKNIVQEQHPSKIDFYTEQAKQLGVNTPNFIVEGGQGKIVVP